MTWQYSQRTGNLSHNGTFVATGYSGRGAARNNPDEEASPFVGPIPRGRYSIGGPRNSEQTGPHVMELSPVGHNARGRDSLQIHGESSDGIPFNSSSGCIILPRPVRETISGSGDQYIEVIE